MPFTFLIFMISPFMSLAIRIYLPIILLYKVFEDVFLVLPILLPKQKGSVCLHMSESKKKYEQERK